MSEAQKASCRATRQQIDTEKKALYSTPLIRHYKALQKQAMANVIGRIRKGMYTNNKLVTKQVYAEQARLVKICPGRKNPADCQHAVDQIRAFNKRNRKKYMWLNKMKCPGTFAARQYSGAFSCPPNCQLVLPSKKY